MCLNRLELWRRLGISLSNGKELTTVAQILQNRACLRCNAATVVNLPPSDIDVVVDVKLVVGTTTCDFKQTAQGE